MRKTRALPRRRYPIQVGLVAAATAACVLITDALIFRSLLNLAWMVGLPLGVAVIGNAGWGRRSLMAIALLSVSLVVGVLIGVNFTSYG